LCWDKDLMGKLGEFKVLEGVGKLN
jgi:hypothetical protein